MIEKLWNEEKIEMLKEMYPNPGIRVKDLAELLGLAEITVRMKASKLGLRRREETIIFDNEKIKELKRMYPNKKYSVEYLARYFGVSEKTIRNKAWKLGLKRNK